MRLGIACYVFQRTIDKTCLYRGDTFVEASSLPLLFPFFHASAPLRTRSTETTNGDDERVKAKHLPAEYGYAINSKERATSALLFHAAARCETIRTPRAPPKKAIGQSTIAIACLSFVPGPRWSFLAAEPREGTVLVGTSRRKERHEIATLRVPTSTRLLHCAYKSRHKTRVYRGLISRGHVHGSNWTRARGKRRAERSVSMYWFARPFSRSRSQAFSRRPFPPEDFQFFSIAKIGRPSIIHPSVYAAPRARYIAFSCGPPTQVCRA